MVVQPEGCVQGQRSTRQRPGKQLRIEVCSPGPQTGTRSDLTTVQNCTVRKGWDPASQKEPIDEVLNLTYKFLRVNTVFLDFEPKFLTPLINGEELRKSKRLRIVFQERNIFFKYVSLKRLRGEALVLRCKFAS